MNEVDSHRSDAQSAQPREEEIAAELSSSLSRNSRDLEPLIESHTVLSSRGDSSSAPHDEAQPQATSADQQAHVSSDPDQQSSSPSSYNSEKTSRSAKASNFLTRIASERELATSLDTITSRDLSIHLFNAFALKRRVGARFENPRRGPSPRNQRTKTRKKHFEDSALDSGPSDEDESKEITYEQVGDPGWHPPRIWTSWPMRVEEVPREWEKREWEDDAPLQVMRDRGSEWSSEILQECLTATTLKTAKMKFRERDWKINDIEANPKLPERKKREEARESQAWQSGRPQQSAVSVEQNEENLEYEPVELADDEMASKILQPSVQQMLAKLDGLLLRLYHARTSYATVKPVRSRPDVEEETEAESDGEPSSETTKHSRKRRRSSNAHKKKFQAQTRQQGSSGSDSPASDQSTNPRSRKRQRTTSGSRPSSRHIESKSRGTSQSLSQASGKLAKPSYKTTFGPLDWSTIIGVATIQGWSPGVVQKAAQRCADLFVEGMQFRVLDENEHMDGDVNVEVLPVASTEGHKKELDGNEEENMSTEDEAPSEPCEPGAREAMHGGVHVDGFMQPIPGKKWWGKVVERRDASLPKGPKGRPRKTVDDESKPKRTRGRPRKPKKNVAKGFQLQ